MESESEEHPPPRISEPCNKSKTAAETLTTSGGGDNDIISRLPDVILCEILSHVTTKLAVATSVLSKRWNKVWTWVPILDFSDWRRYSCKSPLLETHYMDFVDNVLRLNCVPGVRKIHFTSCQKASSRRFNAWLNNLVSRYAVEFDLQLPASRLLLAGRTSLHQVIPSIIFKLPPNFFTNENLVKLNLCNVALKIPQGSVSFPCLKTVVFFSVQLLDDASMKNFLLGCPVIQRLELYRNCHWDGMHVLYICSSMLRYLTLYNSPKFRDFGSKTVIDAPNLTHLHLVDKVASDYEDIQIHLSPLVHVKLDFSPYPNRTESEVFKARLFKLLRKISHVGNMYVALGTMSSLCDASFENVPMFNNLTRMSVELGYQGWPILFHLFRCAPNLVTFVVERICGHPAFNSYQPISVPQCFVSSLKYAVIRDFEKLDEDVEIINYFLKFAVVLKKMTIVSSDILELKKRILILPKSSSACEFEFTNSRR